MDTARLTLTRPTQSGRVPRRRIGHEACVVGNEMFVLGGLEEASGDVQHGLMALDLYTLRWRKVNAKGEGPYLGATFALVVLGFSIFVFTECACDDQSLSWDKVWRFDTDYEVWSCCTTEGNPPPITTDVALFAHGGYIYAFGGCWMGSDDFYRFCPDSRRWVYLKAVSGGASASVLFGVSCLVVRNRVFVLGADDSASDARRSVRVLDFSPSLQTLCMRAVLQHARRIDEIRSYRTSKNGFSARLYPYEVVADYGMESVIWEGEIIVRGGIPEEAEFVGHAKVCTDDECTHMPEVRRRFCDLLRSNEADFYNDIGLLFAAASDLRMDGCVIEPEPDGPLLYSGVEDTFDC